MLNGRRCASCTIAWSLLGLACQSALHLDSYSFERPDAGTVRSADPLTPNPSPNPTPSTNPFSPYPLPPSPLNPVAPSDGVLDAGNVTPPEEVAPPALTRPVLVGGANVDSVLAGLDLGGERRGLCQGGVVIGISFYYLPPGVDLGERMAFIAPICGRFGDEPSAPLEWTRDDGADQWQLSDVLLGDPPGLAAPQLYSELVCPDRLVVAGARGTMDFVEPTYSIRNVTLECAPLGEVGGSSQVLVDRNGATVIAANVLPFQGAEAYMIGCEGGNVATGLLVSSGSWLDGFAMSCAPLSRPRLPDDTCSANDACQSGICDESGLCAAALE
jgi:hypothetical protein